MNLTVVITRDVEDRYRGFLSSAMLELAPGVYASPSLTPRARSKIWTVLAEWHGHLRQGAITMVYPSRTDAGPLSVRQLGTPRRDALVHEGIVLTKLGVNPKTLPSAP